MSGANPPEAYLINRGSNSAASGGSSDGAPAAGHSKRQRRPNVRLGDIGDRPLSIHHEPHPKRTKTLKHSPGAAISGDHHHRGGPKAPPKTRKVTVLALPASGGTRDFKTRRTASGGVGGGYSPPLVPAMRRVSPNWNLDEFGEGFEDVDAVRSSGGEDEDAEDEVYRDVDGFTAEESESPPDAAKEDVPSDRDGRNEGCVQPDSGDRVPSWLNSLGVGQYAPLFQMHEVDDEVFPMLTMEDLKDMGIEAVGSRRKIYCAIQKLKKGGSLTRVA